MCKTEYQVLVKKSFIFLECSLVFAVLLVLVLVFFAQLLMCVCALAAFI